MQVITWNALYIYQISFSSGGYEESTSYSQDVIKSKTNSNQYYLSTLGFSSTRKRDLLKIAKAICNAKAEFPNK